MPRSNPKLSKRTQKKPKKFADFQLSLKSDKYEVKTKAIQSGKRKASSQLEGVTLFSSPKKIKAIEIKSGTRADIKSSRIQHIMNTVGIDNMDVDEYIPSPVDLSDSFAVRVVDLLKDMGGRGLFATTDIDKGTRIGFYMGEEYASTAEFERYLNTHPDADNSYAMNIGRRIIDAARKGNFTRYINFSDSQDNVEFRETVSKGVKVVEVVAIKDIREGQQILVNYNTYNENASKIYYFLNPGDGWLSACEFYEQNKACYDLWTAPDHCEAFQFKKDDQFAINQIAAAVLANQSLRRLQEMNRYEVDLPILKVNPSHQIVDFKESDTFTSLMMACYLGQSENVDWLIRHGANVDQQQNHSGNCPLFFALSGYSSEHASKNNYLKIMISLIKNNANLCVHDRADRTFLHKAIETLSTKDFKKVLNTIKSSSGSHFNELYDYIEDHDLDVVLYALKIKQLDKVQLLLEAHPEFFIPYRSRGTSRKPRQLELFQMVIQDYDKDELTSLYEMLGEDGLNLPQDLLNRLIDSDKRTGSCFSAS
ncbi:eukaryotic huntingtin interacting protein B [Legionella moravica]|uniref:Eukaryotic huntingtin interacting protein B n=1 Tax=Legionella moravica TaxID=39962 RepID=A0A378JWF3_9GAMM|nr:Dot/Icm T4SS effector AnkI/LegAS4 [Legionella moravica]KTD35316.1 eukaryotic huntingtin interacting protein B [Legionella moravica]STX62347.1 eukaryotic huntingtin interacting protein B [Legionella moravica]